MNPRRMWGAAALLLGVAVLTVALWWGGGVTGRAIVGLPDAGPVTAWALPATRLVLDATATLTVGFCAVAAFLLPGDDRLLGPAAYRMLRRAGWFASGWAVACLALLGLTLSDLLGQPLSQLNLRGVVSFALSVSQGQALVVQAVLAVVVAVAGRVALTRTGAAFTAVVAGVGLLPPALTGHAAAAGNHQLAVTSLAVHVLAAALWAGGLAALLTLRKQAVLAAAAARYSRLARWCFIAVALSGVANAAVRLGALDQLWASRYGVLVVGKALALAALGTLGAIHRRRTLSALGEGGAIRGGRTLSALGEGGAIRGGRTPPALTGPEVDGAAVRGRTLPARSVGAGRAFRRLAAGELVVFAATFGLAVALSRAPTPVPADPTGVDPVTDLLGFPAPPPMTAARLLGQPLLDAFFLTAVALGAYAYLVGVWRLRRSGHAWPLARTASWLAGLGLLGAATCLGFGRYAYVLFSVHMAQHMLLAMVVPILLVGGAPLTLALRALRRPTDRSVRGPREWLMLAVHSRPLRTLTHPVAALALYVVSLYGLYLSNALGTLMRYHLGHLAMLTHFVLVGYLFFWVVIGTDPGRRRVATPILVLVHFAGMAFHAFLGVVLMQSNTLIAAGWYTAVHPVWAGPLLADQKLGAGIAWAFGEVPAAVVMAVLVVRWIRDDEREQRRLDRAADRAEATGEDDALARYNEFLRQANAAQR